MVGGLNGLAIALGNCFSLFPLYLKMDSFRIPFFYFCRDSVHSHDSFHERGRDSRREVAD